MQQQRGACNITVLMLFTVCYGSNKGLQKQIASAPIGVLLPLCEYVIYSEKALVRVSQGKVVPDDRQDRRGGGGLTGEHLVARP